MQVEPFTILSVSSSLQHLHLDTRVIDWDKEVVDVSPHEHVVLTKPDKRPWVLKLCGMGNNRYQLAYLVNEIYAEIVKNWNGVVY